MHSPEIVQALERAERARGEISNLLQGEYQDDTKVLLLLAYVDLAMEHHLAIATLMKQGLYGSAFSLVRVLFEILFCAHWVYACALDNDINKIAHKGTFEFPGMGTVVAQIDAKLQTGSFFEDIKKQGWKAMNGYTHSGLLQLSKRFKSTDVEPNYSNEAIVEFLDSTTCAVFLLGRLIPLATGQTEKECLILGLLERFAKKA